MGDTSNNKRNKRPSDEDIDIFSPPITKKKQQQQQHTINNVNTTKNIMAQPNIMLNNKFGSLNHDESLDDDTMDDDQINHTIHKPSRRDKVPIVVSTTDLNQTENQKLRVAIINVAPSVNLKYTKTKLIFFTNSKKEHQTIINKLKELSTPHHTYERYEDKLTKMVLKGLPPLNEDDINNSIQEQGLTPIKTTKMKTKYEDTPVYQVIFEHETEISKIMKIKYVCHVKATWRKYRNPKMLTQCYKCQDFGHGSTNCNNKPKCVKCASDHLTTNCKINHEDNNNIKCANCGKNHVASFTGCEKYQQQLKIIQRKRETTTKGQHRTSAPVVPTYNVGNFPHMRGTTNATSQQQHEPSHQQQTSKQTYSQLLEQVDQMIVVDLLLM